MPLNFDTSPIFSDLPPLPISGRNGLTADFIVFTFALGGLRNEVRCPVERLAYAGTFSICLPQQQRGCSLPLQSSGAPFVTVISHPQFGSGHR